MKNPTPKSRNAELEQMVAVLGVYKERVQFIEDCGLDVVCIDADPKVNLPRSFQIQKNLGDGKYGLLAMHTSLCAAIDTAMKTHGKGEE